MSIGRAASINYIKNICVCLSVDNIRHVRFVLLTLNIQTIEKKEKIMLATITSARTELYSVI